MQRQPNSRRGDAGHGAVTSTFANGHICSLECPHVCQSSFAGGAYPGSSGSAGAYAGRADLCAARCFAQRGNCPASRAGLV